MTNPSLNSEVVYPSSIINPITNLKNMQAMSDYIFKNGRDKILNAYWLITIPDTVDPGLEWMFQIAEAAFKVFGSTLAPPIGGIVANTLCGMMSSWTSNPPGSLNGQFAKLLDRADATAIAVDQQLATYCDGLRNPETWQSTMDTEFTYNGQTVKIGDLATVIVPDESDTGFYPLVKAAIKAFDMQIWRQLLSENYWGYQRDWYRTDDTDQNTPPIKWIQGYIEYYKNTYYTYSWHQGDGGDCSLWIAYEYVLGNKTSGAWLNAASSDYIFKDSTPGTIIKEDALFLRKDVFDFCNTKYLPPNADSNLSKSYLKARQEGKTLLALFQSIGREAIENRVIQKAQGDTFFALNLVKNPKQTIEDFFDVKIPELVQLTIVLESTFDYGLVIHNDHSFSKESNPFFDFLRSQGYDTAESDIMQKLKLDKMFGNELVKHPKKTVNESFNIKIPEQVQLTVVLEDPMNFGLVISNAKVIVD